MRKSAPLFCALLLSLSARRAWIEIPRTWVQYCPQPSLSARRAWIEIVAWLDYSEELLVALRKESVDRNCDLEPIKNPEAVALRKESVDRNLWWGVRKAVGSLSLSARRAWIEIPKKVAVVVPSGSSLSARRAWIEIIFPPVDTSSVKGRSPQGERG